MMQPKSRKENTATGVSIFYCPARDTLCEHINNAERICRRSPCLHDDVKWLAEQEQIKKNIEANTERERLEREAEKNEKPAPIRRQTKTNVQVLEEQIRRKEAKARRLYRANKPRAADSVMRDVMALQVRLRKMKGA